MSKDKKYRDEFGDNGFIDKVFARKQQTALPSGLRKIIVAIAALAAIIILGMIVHGSFNTAPATGEALPIVRADEGPVKIAPDDRGGLKVANKNSTIFDTLKTAQDDNKVENLLEEEEPAIRKSESVSVDTKPVMVEQAQPVVQNSPVQNNVTVADDKTMPPQPVVSSDEIMDQDLQPAKAAAVPVTKPVEPARKQQPEPPAQPMAVAKPVTSGSTYIQLASVKSEADAQKQWASFKSKNSELAGLSLRVQKADLGDKGVYYRVQAGPLSSDAAQSTCLAIKGRGGNCLVAK